jgi:hypothetical protein
MCRKRNGQVEMSGKLKLWRPINRLSVGPGHANGYAKGCRLPNSESAVREPHGWVCAERAVGTRVILLIMSAKNSVRHCTAAHYKRVSNSPQKRTWRRPTVLKSGRPSSKRYLRYSVVIINTPQIQLSQNLCVIRELLLLYPISPQLKIRRIGWY